jgi:hypothetical protein
MLKHQFQVSGFERSNAGFTMKEINLCVNVNGMHSYLAMLTNPNAKRH